MVALLEFTGNLGLFAGRAARRAFVPPFECEMIWRQIGEVGWKSLPLVLSSGFASPITKRVYNMALDEFFGWYAQEPRPGFGKATVSAWRVSLEARGLGSSSIIVRMSAIRKLAVEATDNAVRGLNKPCLGYAPSARSRPGSSYTAW
jgi:hypothetical protein